LIAALVLLGALLGSLCRDRLWLLSGRMDLSMLCLKRGYESRALGCMLSMVAAIHQATTIAGRWM
jgi:hypothetical protein